MLTVVYTEAAVVDIQQHYIVYILELEFGAMFKGPSLLHMFGNTINAEVLIRDFVNEMIWPVEDELTIKHVSLGFIETLSYT